MQSLLLEGLVHSGDEWTLVDFWGEPYYLIFDTNQDKKIASPEYEAAKIKPDRARRNSDKPLSPVLEVPRPLIHPWFIYSAGPDHDPETWDDNITAWESYRWKSHWTRGW